jgi:L-malate glycosyltransferase
VRILQVTSAKTFGGGERHLIDLCRGLIDRGHEVFVALRPTNEWQDKFDFLPRENLFYVSLRNSFGVLSASRIAGFVRRKDIQLIHAHVARDYIPASLASALVKNARFVLTRHVLFPLQPFNRIALKNLSKAIAVSSAVEASLKKVFPANKIATIPNGIEIDHWAAADKQKLREEFRFFHGIPFDAPLIGTIGELIPLKGQRDFVLAANEAAKRFPAAHFVVVGKDNSLDKSFRRELRRLVKVFGLEERFLWLDWVEDTAPLLASLDIFVSASHSESFGLAILEAMATGVPVIATETAGAKELLAGEDVFVPIKDPVALAAKIGDLLEDEERCRRLAEKCQTAAGDRYSLKRMIDETEKLYKTLV